MKLNFEPFYQEYLDTLAAYRLASSTIYVDQGTIAPKKGAAYANEALGILAREAFKIQNNPETIAMIKEYYQRLPENSLEKKEVGQRLDEILDNEAVPAEVYADFVKARADSETLWHKAKEASDYTMFKDTLKTVMEKELALLHYSPRYQPGREYDMMLDSYEKGMDQKQYDAFFDVIKEEIPPLIAKIREAAPIDTAPLHQKLDLDRQEKFMNIVMNYMQADPQRVYLSTTEHPFTDFLSHDDIRITTHYYPDAMLSAILSTVHEYGHALYGLQMDPDFEKTMLVSGVGSAAHESQSRFLENHIGRSHAFWKGLYPSLIETFPELKDVSLDDLVAMINASKGSLIRTEADELTYPLHILIRYEIEKEIARGTLDYEALPEIWADKYEKYLGVRPENDKEGVLQDMHWSAAYLGYFPTYALGSAYAAQLYEAMEKELDVKQALESGNFKAITDWQEQNVHRFANSKSMKEIVEEVSGKPFDPRIYTNYLKDKYTKLYNLK